MPNLTIEMINQGNAQHAAQLANVTKDETITGSAGEREGRSGAGSRSRRRGALPLCQCAGESVDG